MTKKEYDNLVAENERLRRENAQLRFDHEEIIRREMVSNAAMNEVIWRNQIPEGLPCGQFVYRVEGDQNILFVDINVVHLYGCESFEEFFDYVGNSFRNMVHPDDLKKVESMINAQTLESGHRHDYVRYRIITKQGDIRYIEDFGHIIYDADGNGYYYVFIVDVGEKEYYNEYFNSFAESQIEAMNWKVDHLTGLISFAAFREELESRPSISDTGMCTVIVFDIIGLQKINENAGRREGDKLIRSLVQSIYKNMPKDSGVYRGHEAEIIVICKDVSEHDVLDQIRETTSSCHCEVFYGAASAEEVYSGTGRTGKKITITQILEAAQSDLRIKKMLYRGSSSSGSLEAFVKALEEANLGIGASVPHALDTGGACEENPDGTDDMLPPCADRGYQAALTSKEFQPIIEFIRRHRDHWDGGESPAEPEGEQGYEDLVAENRSLHAKIRSLQDELAYQKLDNEERIRCEVISNTAMKEALKQNHPSDEIESFLASVGKSLEVERIYIFEDDPEGEGTNNTYEWCDEGVSPQIDNLQKVPFEAVEWWYEQFEQGKDIHILNLEAIKDTEPVTYSYLKPQGINSLIAKRLMHGDRIVGFFGVDNPRLEFMADISSFLDTLSNFLSSLIQNRNIYLRSEARYVSELEEKNAALNEALHKAEDANMAKSQFLSSMSHDIRTPLNAVIGMTAIAREHLGDRERVEDCLQKITTSSNHLLALINDILDMAKIESGKMTLYMENLSLNEILESVSTIIRIQAADKRLEYNVYVHDMISNYVMGDSLRLRQILVNLLGNSVKFTPEGGQINIELWQEESSQGDDYASTHIKVSDTGIGMSSEFLKTIFESFSREESKVRTMQGTGLGMAITKSIVDAFGGTIEVDSERNHGSTFHIVLDLKRGKDNGIGSSQQEEEKISLDGMKILLAEDNDLNAEIATMILEENGAEVTRALDGMLAVQYYEQSEVGTYNAVLMDLRMPNMDGLQAAKSIRALPRADAGRIPIIAMTADAFADDVQKCLEAGMNAHISKPIDVDILKQTLIKLSRNR